MQIKMIIGPSNFLTDFYKNEFNPDEKKQSTNCKRSYQINFSTVILKNLILLPRIHHAITKKQKSFHMEVRRQKIINDNPFFFCQFF